MVVTTRLLAGGPVLTPALRQCDTTACKASQTDPAFQVVARVEAFIAGWGLEEALKRPEAYADAGADAILMHRCVRRGS